MLLRQSMRPAAPYGRVAERKHLLFLLTVTRLDKARRVEYWKSQINNFRECTAYPRAPAPFSAKIKRGDR